MFPFTTSHASNLFWEITLLAAWIGMIISLLREKAETTTHQPQTHDFGRRSKG
jgi:hypothetical protein